MESILSRLWWAVALRGVLAIIFGLAAFFWPDLFLLTVVYIFGAYALADGVVALVAAATGYREAGPWWALLLEGVAGVAAGVVAFAWPQITEVALLLVIAAWCLATGVFEIAAAVRLRRAIRGEWGLALSGVVSIVLGLALALAVAIWPAAGVVALAWWIGTCSVAFGVLLLALASRLRSLARQALAPQYLPPQVAPGGA
ncbi:MAG: hypothetical protein JWO38_4655 [Gemmataceae bacterium]|nr:hypothetical protein [Gemmataceae bacterium]